MNPCKTIIVEDSQSTLNDLLKLLKGHENIIAVAQTAGSCSETIDFLINESFELSIFDIELSDGNCFDVINKVDRNRIGEIVFCTSFGGLFIDELIKAKPIDYISKPFGKEKVQKMVLTVQEFFSKKQSLNQCIALFKNDTGTKIIVPFKDIFYIQYYNGKSIYHFREGDKEFSTATDIHPLSDQFKKLNNKFVQSQRNYILNIDFLKELEPNEKEGFFAVMPDKTTVPISKAFKDLVFSRKGIA